MTRLLILPLALALATSCAEPEPERQGPGDGRNIVVVVIDTLRADHLATYGYNKNTASYIEGIAERGVVFDAAYGASTWTAPSTASLFTSLYPKDHGVWTGLWTFDTVSTMGFEVELNRIPPAAETMPEFMQSMGYRTYGYADNPNIDATMGFARGFDHFSPGMDRGAPDLAAEVLTKSAEIANGPRPSFLYLHFMDPHIPYERRDPYFELEGTRGTDDQQEQLANYDSEIGRVDAALAQLAEALHWDKDTVIVITSDHGEEFGDHGGSAHGPQLYNELLKVPMIVFGADENGLNLFEAKRVEQPVCGIDLLPTLRGLLGDDASDGDRGIDLTPLLTGTNPVAGAAPTTERILFPERPMEFVLEPFDVRAAIDRDLKLYDHSEQPTASLYNMQVDPKEVTDIAAESPEHVERLALQLQQHFDQAPLHERSFAPAIEIDSQAAKDLQRLGYAGDE